MLHLILGKYSFTLPIYILIMMIIFTLSVLFVVVSWWCVGGWVLVSLHKYWLLCDWRFSVIMVVWLQGFSSLLLCNLIFSFWWYVEGVLPLFNPFIRATIEWQQNCTESGMDDLRWRVLIIMHRFQVLYLLEKRARFCFEFKIKLRVKETFQIPWLRLVIALYLVLNIKWLFFVLGLTKITFLVLGFRKESDQLTNVICWLHTVLKSCCFS